jgi:hypothetical protein
MEFPGINEYFVLLRASLDKLESFAEEISYKMLCDPLQLEKNLRISIADNKEITSYSPYESIYVPYIKAAKHIFWKPKYMSHPFRSSVRQKLSGLIIDRAHDYDIIADTVEGQQRTLGSLRIKKNIFKGHILAFFPLHNPPIRESLATDWLSWNLPWELPFYQIKVETVSHIFAY